MKSCNQIYLKPLWNSFWFHKLFQEILSKDDSNGTGDDLDTTQRVQVIEGSMTLDQIKDIRSHNFPTPDDADDSWIHDFESGQKQDSGVGKLWLLMSLI